MVGCLAMTIILKRYQLELLVIGTQWYKIGVNSQSIYLLIKPMYM